MRQNNFAGVDGEPSGDSSMHRPGSEELLRFHTLKKLLWLLEEIKKILNDPKKQCKLSSVESSV